MSYIIPTHIDGHICSNSKCHLPLIVCRPRKTHFHFSFVCSKQTEAGCFCFPCTVYTQKTELHIIYMYSYKYVYICTAVSNGVCRLSVCWRRSKRKLSVCKRTIQTKQTKRTYPSMPTHITYSFVRCSRKLFFFRFMFLHWSRTYSQRHGPIQNDELRPCIFLWILKIWIAFF